MRPNEASLRPELRAERKGSKKVPKNIALTLACGNYEIVRALKDGVVAPDGIDLTILTDMDSSTRHWRFLREGHFDVAENCLPGYQREGLEDHPDLGAGGSNTLTVE